MKILLIDDEILFCETFQEILVKEGYQVIVVHGGEEALKILFGQPIHVAIIDINLPDISGLEILKTIKSSGLDTCAVMLTGYATLESSIKALNEGAYAYITKPYQIDEIKAIIRNAIEQQRLAVENRRLLETLKLNNQELVKANEQLKELDKLKSEFLAMVSHELKTPLTTIIGYSTHLLQASTENNLREKTQFSEIHDGLSRITRNGYLLLDLINKLLEFSKIEAGKISLELEEFDLGEIIEEVLLITMPIAQEKKLELIFEPVDFHEIIEADRQKIKQVFLNLITNALKFTEKPKSKIFIQVRTYDHSIQVAVSDQGIGIRQEDQNMIFERFRQIDSSLSRKLGGTGLGLSIVKKFIDVHQGRIWVESKPQEGSRFIFQLPKRQKMKAVIQDYVV